MNANVDGQIVWTSLSSRFISLISRDRFDYTEWQRHLWKDETIESLSRKAQMNWERKHGNA